MEQPKDDKLWRIAQKRAHFRKSAYSYIIVNAFLWCIWRFTRGDTGNFGRFPWPAWVMLGWGLSLAKEYYEAYHGSKSDIAEREYEKLKEQGKL